MAAAHSTMPNTRRPTSQAACSNADAAWLSPMDPDRIIVAPSGPSLCVEGHAHRAPVRRRPHVGLAVSTLEPRKNLDRLLDAWLVAPEDPADVPGVDVRQVPLLMSSPEATAALARAALDAARV